MGARNLCLPDSPSQTERKPNERVKTDKRDAQKLAKLYRNGDITPVRIPPPLDEAVRDLCRARTDATDDLVRSKLRLISSVSEGVIFSLFFPLLANLRINDVVSQNSSPLFLF